MTYICILNNIQYSMLKDGQSIIHVEIKDTHEHFYFGSLAAMFQDSRVKYLPGIKYQTFRKKGLSEDKPFENDLVIIRKSKIIISNHSESKE